MPSSLRFFSICLLRSMASRSSWLKVQPIFAAYVYPRPEMYPLYIPADFDRLILTQEDNKSALMLHKTQTIFSDFRFI